MSHFPACFAPTEEDISKMLACQTHIGTKNCETNMMRYVYKRRSDGIHIIDLRKTWEKLVFAARVIVAVENPLDVAVLTARPWGQRAVLKFAKYTGTQPFAGRFTPGTFTNRIEKNFAEPRLLVVCDPFTDAQPIRESSYVNLPTIAFCHTDSPTRHVDIVIPSNNKAKLSIALMWWMLAREVLRIRNPASDRTTPWSVMVDMFMFRDMDEQEKAEAEQRAALEAANTPAAAAFSADDYAGGSAVTPGAYGDASAAGGEWSATAPDPSWSGNTPAPTGEWGAPSTQWSAEAAPAGVTPGGPGHWDASAVGQGWDAAK